VWYYQNDKQLNFCSKIAFIGRAKPISAKGALIMNNRVDDTYGVQKILAQTWL